MSKYYFALIYEGLSDKALQGTKVISLLLSYRSTFDSR